MSNWNLEIHPAAAAEAGAASSWYRQRSLDAAQRFVSEVNETVSRIIDAPERWQRSRYGTRHLKLANFPYLVAYRCFGTTVQVLAIAHGSRKPNYWKDRL